MHKLKHTPGPWEYFGALVHIPQTKNIGPKGRFIADCKSCDEYGVSDNANARLISCAPEMIEALIDTIKTESEGDKDCNLICDNCFHKPLCQYAPKIRLIEKATGEKIEDLLK